MHLYAFPTHLPESPFHEIVEIRIAPNKGTDISELRFWYKNKLVDTQKMKTSDIGIVQF